MVLQSLPAEIRCLIYMMVLADLVAHFGFSKHGLDNGIVKMSAKLSVPLNVALFNLNMRTRMDTELLRAFLQSCVLKLCSTSDVKALQAYVLLPEVAHLSRGCNPFTRIVTTRNSLDEFDSFLLKGRILGNIRSLVIIMGANLSTSSNRCTPGYCHCDFYNMSHPSKLVIGHNHVIRHQIESYSDSGAYHLPENFILENFFNDLIPFPETVQRVDSINVSTGGMQTKLGAMKGFFQVDLSFKLEFIGSAQDVPATYAYFDNKEWILRYQWKDEQVEIPQLKPTKIRMVGYDQSGQFRFNVVQPAGDRST